MQHNEKRDGTVRAMKLRDSKLHTVYTTLPALSNSEWRGASSVERRARTVINGSTLAWVVSTCSLVTRNTRLSTPSPRRRPAAAGRILLHARRCACRPAPVVHRPPGRFPPWWRAATHGDHLCPLVPDERGYTSCESCANAVYRANVKCTMDPGESRPHSHPPGEKPPAVSVRSMWSTMYSQAPVAPSRWVPNCPPGPSAGARARVTRPIWHMWATH
jgi:hypothetical protein